MYIDRAHRIECLALRGLQMDKTEYWLVNNIFMFLILVMASGMCIHLSKLINLSLKICAVY
jgi:hypothetical protein